MKSKLNNEKSLEEALIDLYINLKIQQNVLVLFKNLD